MFKNVNWKSSKLLHFHIQIIYNRSLFLVLWLNSLNKMTHKGCSFKFRDTILHWSITKNQRSSKINGLIANLFPILHPNGDVFFIRERNRADLLLLQLNSFYFPFQVFKKMSVGKANYRIFSVRSGKGWFT